MDRPKLPSRRHFLRAGATLLGISALEPGSLVFAGSRSQSQNVGSTVHLVVMTIGDKDRLWTAYARVGDDPAATAKVVRFRDSAGKPHRGLEAWFYADCVEAGATRLDNAYDYINFRSVSVTYDGVAVPVPASSKKDGTFDFWRGCRCPAIRYGKQVGWSRDRIDWSLLPSYARHPQAPWDDSHMDYTFNGLGNATTPSMAQTGARPDIGYMPVWDMAFLTNPSDATWAVVRRTEDHIGWWGMIYTSDPDTGHIIDIHKYPGVTTLPSAQVYGWKGNELAPYGGSYDGDTLIPVKDVRHSWKTTASPFKPNGAHLTSYALLAAMITGTARDRDHASFWANWPLLEISPKYTASGGVMLGAQRRAAWCLRDLFMASYISADTRYFAAETARNLPIAMAQATHPFGIFSMGHGSSAPYRYHQPSGTYRAMAPWMQYYLMTTLDAVSHKNPEWIPFARYLAKFITTWQRYPFSFVKTVYNLPAFAPDGSHMTDFPEMVRMSLMHNYKYTKAQADAVVNAKTVKEAYEAVKAAEPRWRGRYRHDVSDYRGDIRASDSYPAMAGAATVAAADSGAPEMEAALAYWRKLPTKPDFSRDGKFDLTPRGG